MLFSTNTNPDLARQVAKQAKLKLGKLEIRQFSDGEIYVQVKEKVKGQKVFILGSTFPPADNLLKLLILTNALKSNGAKKITAIIPYFGYARQDKIDRPGEPISAKLFADLLKKAGINQFITIDIHSRHNQKFLGPNLINLEPFKIFARYIKKNINLKNTIIVAPDNGAKSRAEKLANLLNHLPVLVLQKIRPKQNVAKILKFKKNIKGKNIIIIDDMIDTASTVSPTCEELKRHQVKNIYIFVTHGILSGPAIERLKKAQIKNVIITDTYPLPKEKRLKKIKVLSISSLLIKNLK